MFYYNDEQGRRKHFVDTTSGNFSILTLIFIKGRDSGGKECAATKLIKTKIAKLFSQCSPYNWWCKTVRFDKRVVCWSACVRFYFFFFVLFCGQIVCDVSSNHSYPHHHFSFIIIITKWYDGVFFFLLLFLSFWNFLATFFLWCKIESKCHLIGTIILTFCQKEFVLKDLFFFCICSHKNKMVVGLNVFKNLILWWKWNCRDECNLIKNV